MGKQKFIYLIKSYIDAGKQVLFSFPNCTNNSMVSRLKYAFDDLVGVYHSRFGMNERTELWRDVHTHLRFNHWRTILVFLPFRDLGLVIVDEEHENSFKQHDPSPRYQARDVAVYMGSHYSCQVVLGTATPSLEAAYNVNNGKYGLSTLKQRYRGFLMPEIQLVDMLMHTRENE